MKIKVRETKLKGNQVSVMLDIHRNGKRIQKSTKIRYCLHPKTALERQEKKEKQEIIRKMISNLESDAIYEDNFLEKRHQLNKNFFEYCEEFIDSRPPHQVEAYDSAVKQLKKFVKKDKLACCDIDEKFLIQFRNYLDTQVNGITPYGYFEKLKKIIKEATYSKYFLKNPTERIRNSKGKTKEKETLNAEDIKILNNTKWARPEIKDAFLFSYLTGLRFSDVSRLKWENIKEGYLDIIQKKTQERLILNLHEDIVHLIGNPKKNEDLIFKLPPYPCCLNNLKRLVKKAGIEKHITWHCSRHSFATALVLKNENIMVVSKLLGHKSLTETQRYVRVGEMSKQNAINNIPTIF